MRNFRAVAQTDTKTIAEIGLAGDFDSSSVAATGRLAGGVAHEFNNLLTVILGYSESLLGRLTGRDYEDAVEIKKAALSASAVTRQLLTFSRKLVVQPRVMNVNELIRSISPQIERLLGRACTLVTALDPDLANINADARQIEQMIGNLAANARDAMPGGGQFVIETGNENSDGCSGIRIVVRDTGCGIPRQIRQRIFEPFFTTKRGGRSTGLGLSIVHAVVSASGGTIRVVSEAGSGAVFEIFFPKAVEPIRAVVPSGWSRALERKTVLLVEDEESVRRLLHNIFEQKGFNLLEAESGEEALLIAEYYEGDIDLLVTDIVMAGIDGMELSRRLRRVRPDVGVLLISGYAHDVLDGQEPGEEPTPFLAKPFTSSELLEKVAEVLQSPRLSRVQAAR